VEVVGGGKQVATIENQHVHARFQWRRGGGGGKPAATIENEHTRARFRWWRGGGSGKPAATIENEHTCARFPWWRWRRWQTRDGASPISKISL